MFQLLILIYGVALANWQTLNERVKKIKTCQGLNPGPLLCQIRILPLRHITQDHNCPQANVD